VCWVSHVGSKGKHTKGQKSISNQMCSYRMLVTQSPLSTVGNLRQLLGRLNCNTSSDVAIHISVMQLHTAVLDQSGSHINFTCRLNKSTVAVTWNYSYILLYFEELPEYLRCASGKLRPQYEQEFGFVLHNYDTSYIRSLLQEWAQMLQILLRLRFIQTTEIRNFEFQTQ
jgi:hypothetical protein